jgi:hypothetical protein
MLKSIHEVIDKENMPRISEAKRKIYKFLVDFRTELIFLVFITS